MFLAITIFAFPIIALIAIFLRFRGIRLAYVWLFLFASAFVLFTIVILAVPANLIPFVVPEYFSRGANSISIIFQLSEKNKLMGLGLFTAILSYLATDSALPRGNQSLFRWVEVLISGAASWLVLLAGNAWTILIAWTVFDTVSVASDFVFRRRPADKFLSFYLPKFGGSMILVYIISRTYLSNQQSLIGEAIPNFGAMLYAAVFLHAGFLFDFSKSHSAIEEKHTALIRYLGMISNFFLLSQISLTRITPFLELLLKMGFCLAAMVAILKWYNSKDDHSHISTFNMSIAFIAGFLFVSSNQTGLRYFLLSILNLTWLYFYTERTKGLLMIAFINLYLFSGMPVALNNATFRFFLQENRIIEAIGLVVPTALMVAGISQFLQRPEGKFDSLDNINQAVYIAGLLFPIGFAIYISTSTLQGSSMSFAWAGVLQIALSLGLFFLYKRFKKNKSSITEKSGSEKNSRDALSMIARAFNTGYSLLGDGLQFASRLFETEGGILWSIVFLSLLLTIISALGGIS